MGAPSRNMPFTTSCTVPSSPTATTNRIPRSKAEAAASIVSPRPARDRQAVVEVSFGERAFQGRELRPRPCRRRHGGWR